MRFDILIRSARAAKGLSQALISERSGFAIPNLSAFENRRRDPRFESAEAVLAATGFQLIAIPTTRETVAEIASVVAQDLATGDTASALRSVIQISDNLEAESGANKVALAITPPASVGNSGWDALIAGVVEYRLGSTNQSLPDWVNEKWRVAPKLQELGISGKTWGLTAKDSPKALVKRNVLLSTATLESA